MKFLSYEANTKQEYETEIRDADPHTSHAFIQTWVPDYLVRVLRDPAFSYSLFPWDKIIAVSRAVGSPLRCFGALTGDRLDGLVCLGIETNKLMVEYIATAPWNYHTVGKMRRIGSGLVFFTIRAYTRTIKGSFFYILFQIPRPFTNPLA